jgi:putative membrane protein
MMNGMMGNWGGWGMGFGGIFMLLFWALIVLGIVALAKWIFPSSGGWGRSSSRPLDILRERYARGEISREEYEHMRRELAA